MLIFGHAGLTLGAAVLLSGALRGSHSVPGQGRADDFSEPGTGAVSVRGRFFSGAASWLTSLAGRVDIRLLLVAAFLPDIVDKPVGLLFFRDNFSNSRLFGHTLLFTVLIFLAGLYLYRSRGKRWLLVLAFGGFTHLVLDQMWHVHQTLLWPLYGFAFDKVDITGWAPGLLDTLFTDPVVYITELVGIVILIWFSLLVVRRGTLLDFLRRGEIR